MVITMIFIVCSCFLIAFFVLCSGPSIVDGMLKQKCFKLVFTKLPLSSEMASARCKRE